MTEVEYGKYPQDPKAYVNGKRISIVDGKPQFKGESLETGIPYQTLINLYLDDCAKKKKKLELIWK